MGYDIHLTRRTNWFDDGGPEIALHEWRALVAIDPEMRLDGYAEARLPDGGVFRAEDPSLAVWLAYSGHGVDGNMAWIWHSGGNVMAKNPDAEIRAKMWRLAQALGARVQGDESEFYGPDGEALVEDRPGPQAHKPWWRIW